MLATLLLGFSLPLLSPQVLVAKPTHIPSSSVTVEFPTSSPFASLDDLEVRFDTRFSGKWPHRKRARQALLDTCEELGWESIVKGLPEEAVFYRFEFSSEVFPARGPATVGRISIAVRQIGRFDRGSEQTELAAIVWQRDALVDLNENPKDPYTNAVRRMVLEFRKEAFLKPIRSNTEEARSFDQDDSEGFDFSPGGPVSDQALAGFVVSMDVKIAGEEIGTMVFDFWPDKAPITVRNFLRYASEGFYNGLTFHRVMRGFVIQGGDPMGTGMGKGKYPAIPAEFSDDDKYSHQFGVISMARPPGPNSATCQFFVCNGDAGMLDGKYASFGRLTSGTEVLNRISAIPIGRNRQGEMSRPLKKVVMTKVSVQSKEN